MSLTHRLFASAAGVLALAAVAAPLRLAADDEPRAKPGPPVPTLPEAPTAPGTAFEVARGRGQELHLVTIEGDEVNLRTRKDGAFGPPRNLFRPAKGSEANLGPLALHAGDDGDLHVFLLLLDADSRGRPQYARVTPSKEKAPVWVAINDMKTPHQSFDLPDLVPKRKDVLEVYLHARMVRTTAQDVRVLDNQRLLCGVLEKGRYRHLRSIPTQTGAYSDLDSAKVLRGRDGEAVALFHGGQARQSLAWTGLGRFQPRLGGSFPRDASLRDAQVLIAPDGQVDLAAAVFDEPMVKDGQRTLRFSLWLAHGKIGERLQESGVLPELPGRSFHLTRAPDGAVHVCAVARSAAQKELPQIHLWRLPFDGAPRAIPTPWIGPPFGTLRAMFFDARRATIAWGTGEQVYVQDFTIPES